MFLMAVSRIFFIYEGILLSKRATPMSSSDICHKQSASILVMARETELSLEVSEKLTSDLEVFQWYFYSQWFSNPSHEINQNGTDGNKFLFLLYLSFETEHRRATS